MWFKTLLAIGVSGFVDANVISVNFHANDASAASDHQLSSGEVAGLEPIGSWNNISIGASGAHNTAGAIFSTTQLQDSAGNSNVATINPSANSTWFTGYAASSAAAAAELELPGNDDDLFNSYLALNGPNGDGSPADTAILEISGLGATYTASGYQLIIYSDSDRGPTSAARTSVFTVNPNNGAPITRLTEDDGSSEAAPNTFSGTYIESDNTDTDNAYSNYTIIENLTAESFTIEVTSPDGGRGAISGFQIIPGNSLAAPSITSFSSDRQYVNTGTSTNLSWVASNFTQLTLNPGSVDVTGLTTIEITPTSSAVYTLTAIDEEGQSTSSEITLTVGPPRPNIVIFLVDDMGVTDTSVPFILDENGQPIPNEFNNFHATPNMETLAANGMKFTKAYATPVCSSTRASLMTGFNTIRHGVISQVAPSGNDPVTQNPVTNSHRPPNDWKRTGMQPDDVTMPNLLGEAGYRSIHIGKGHFGSTISYATFPQAIGFDVNIGGDQSGSSSYLNYTARPNLSAYSGTGTFLTDALTIETETALENATEDGVPFLLYFSHYALHTPFTTDPNATGNYDSAVSTGHRRFSTMVEGMDRSLGQTIDALEELNIAEETLIIFLGDNGSDNPATTNNGFASGIYSDFPQRGKKATAWEGGIHVPMIVAWAKPNPDNPFQAAFPIPANSIETDIVTVWDILPTTLNITGVESSQEFDGHDLTPYLTGQPGTHRPQDFLMYLPIDHRNDYFAVYREEDWKLHYYFADNSFQLYHLPTDLTESNDRASTEPERVLSMARQMAKEFEEGWGIRGELWPTLAPTNGGARPYVDDPFLIDYSVQGRNFVDSDQDGIPDAIEDADGNGLVSTGETDSATSDTDGDGNSDGVEAAIGTNPLDPSSFFRTTYQISSSNDLILTWPSTSGNTFNLESSSNLLNWDIEQENIPASTTGDSTSVTITPADETRFYRITLEL